MEKRVPMPYGVQAKSYYKYFERELLPIPEEKMAVLADSFGQPGKGLSIYDRMLMLNKDTVGSDVGIFRLPEGGAVLKNKLFMPGVKAEMIEWWFGWHPSDPVRYAIWDPYDHFNIQLSDEDLRKLRDPNVPNAEKCYGVTHYATETFVPGMEPSSAILSFKSPEEFGVTPEMAAKAKADGCDFILCTNIATVNPDGSIGGSIVAMHSIFDTEDGCDYNSCFWFGYTIEDGQVIKLVPDGVEIPPEPMMGLLRHNFFEYTNLGWLLPRIYPEERNNW